MRLKGMSNAIEGLVFTDETGVTLAEQALRDIEIERQGSEGDDSLGVPRNTLYDKMKKYGLDKSDYKG